MSCAVFSVAAGAIDRGVALRGRALDAGNTATNCVAVAPGITSQRSSKLHLNLDATAGRVPMPQLSLDGLLGDPVGRHEQICLALQRLVGRVALRIDFPSRQCREELTHDVFLYCLRQVGKQPRGGDEGNAYRWFSVVAKRKFWARLRRERVRQAKSLSRIDHNETPMRPVPQLSAKRVEDRAPLVRGKALQRLAEYLDALLDRTLAQHRDQADAGELQLTRGMVLALQEVRHRVSGSYRRLREEDLGYTERYRMGRDDELRIMNEEL